jgi:hypothetical protein
MRELVILYLALYERSRDKVDTLRKTCVAPHHELSTRTPTHDGGGKQGLGFPDAPCLEVITCCSMHSTCTSMSVNN